MKDKATVILAIDYGEYHTGCAYTIDQKNVIITADINHKKNHFFTISTEIRKLSTILDKSFDVILVSFPQFLYQPSSNYFSKSQLGAKKLKNHLSKAFPSIRIIFVDEANTTKISDKYLATFANLYGNKKKLTNHGIVAKLILEDWIFSN